ncbi:MAG: hypothetical protein FJX75_19485 [Armatimonadetes bacterium]|nr:hypothetical protein [Armatimonadota bacterium]
MSDTLSKAKEYAGEKWEDLTTSLSTHRAVRGLQKQITKLVGERDRVMIEIGRKVHALYGRGKVRNADILPLCGRIDEIGKRIDALNAQVRDLSQPKPTGVLTEAKLADESELDEAAEDDEGEAPAEPEAEEQSPEAAAEEPAAAPDETPEAD